MRVSFIKARPPILGGLTLLLVCWGSLSLGQELAAARGAEGDAPEGIEEPQTPAMELNTDEDILDLGI